MKKGKIIETLKNFKDEIIEKTLALLPQALSGDKANVSFNFSFDDEGEVKVDYLYYLGSQQLGFNYFYTIKTYEKPDPEEFGFESIEEMDFDVVGYREEIENSIDQHIWNLEVE